MSQRPPHETDPHRDALLSERTALAGPAPAGAADMPACVVVTRGPCLGQRFDLDDAAVVGRAADVDIRLDHKSVSRHHCRIWRKRHEYWIADLGATNRTCVNGQPVDEVVLRDGDRLTIGELLLKFLAPGNAENAMISVLAERATRDALTGLVNRRELFARFERELALARRGRALSLVVLDIDHFKRINDSHGHPAGDEVLRQVAHCLARSVRESDVVARVGGEEFAVLAIDATGPAAAAMAESLRKAIESLEIDVEQQRVAISASFGVAAFGTESEIDALYRRADQALYEAKAGGRNRVVVAPPAPPPRWNATPGARR
jgi:diguanylate cyclase (GGDEF)-like protein